MALAENQIEAIKGHASQVAAEEFAGKVRLQDTMNPYVWAAVLLYSVDQYMQMLTRVEPISTVGMDEDELATAEVAAVRQVDVDREEIEATFRDALCSQFVVYAVTNGNQEGVAKETVALVQEAAAVEMIRAGAFYKSMEHSVTAADELIGQETAKHELGIS